MLRRYVVSFISCVLALSWFSSAGAAPAVGQPPPDFNLVSTDGKSVRLSDFRGKHYGAGNMQAVQQEASAKGVVWLAINSTEIGSAELAGMAFTRSQVKFAYAKSESLPGQCHNCAYLKDCWGECPKNRVLRTADGEPGLNYLCSGFQQFFAHATPQIDAIVAKLRQQQVRPGPRMGL